MSELRPIILGFGHGLKDSLLGTIVLLRVNSILEERQTEGQFKTDAQSSRRTRQRGKQNELDKKTDRYARNTISSGRSPTRIIHNVKLSVKQFDALRFIYDQFHR